MKNRINEMKDRINLPKRLMAGWRKKRINPQKRRRAGSINKKKNQN
jgi:hypothetical protein